MRNMLQNGQINFNKPISLSSPITPWWYLPQDKAINNEAKSDRVLLKISTILPFDLFPDTVTVDQNKVTITRKDFFGTEQISCVLIENITHVEANTGILIATLHIIDSSNMRNPIYIDVQHLTIADALKARKVIQGLISARKHSVNLNEKNPLEEIREVEQLRNGETTIFVPNSEKIPHYYGDLIRILLIIAGIIMLVALPIFYTLTILPLNIVILTILGMIVLAGAISPRYIIITILESFVSVALFLIFENTAIYYFINGENIYYGLVNQTLALIFFVATYYSIKTVRGFLLRGSDDKTS